MKIFQIGNIYPSHLNELRSTLDDLTDEGAINSRILADVPQAQLLAPAISDDPSGRICFPQYESGLRLWARKKGMPITTNAEDIVLAQIEEHASEIFYTVDAFRHSTTFLRKLPGSVRLKIGWLGSKLVGRGWDEYDAIVSNFPTLNAIHSKMGCKTFYLTPSYESQTDFLDFINWDKRQSDVFFSGTYSRHHQKRANLIERVTHWAINTHGTADIHLLKSRFTPIAERTPLGFIAPFSKVRRPKNVRGNAKEPVFGREMYNLMANTKIVINMAVDIAGSDRGNMRCFESLSTGALLISDVGDYPEGFVDGETHLSYSNNEEAIALIEKVLNHPDFAQKIAKNGWEMIRSRYSKERQLRDFANLCDALL